MKLKELEREIEKILPKLEERISYRIAGRIIEALREEFYPPESALRKEFIKGVKEAEKRIKLGKSKKFKNIQELEKYLRFLAR